jgi:hypothetical protein
MTELHPYDQTRAMHIGEVVDCTPEVQIFSHGETRYRIILLGKRGLRGYTSEPVFAFEMCNGRDALGIETWMPSHDEYKPWLGALFMAIRQSNEGKALVL